MSEEKQFTKTDVVRLCKKAVLDEGYGECAAILIVRRLEGILYETSFAAHNAPAR